MKIWACYIVYNNADYLQASLSTIVHHVDKVLLIDGRFSYYPGVEAYSTDGTVELIQKFKREHPDKVIFVGGKEYVDEPTKRNVYMDMVPDGDWIWIVDGDEIPYGQLERVRPYLETKDSLIVPVWFRHAFLHRPEFIHMRFIHKRDGMRYEGNHFCIMYQGRNILDINLWRDIEPIPVWLIHFGEMRHGGKTFGKNEFREKLEEVELRFTDAVFPGKFYCIIPDCENGANEIRLASRGMSYVLTLCKWHKRQFLQQPLLDVIEKYGDSKRNLKIKEIYATHPSTV